MGLRNIQEKLEKKWDTQVSQCMQRVRAVTEMPMLLKPRNGFCMRSTIGPTFVESSQNVKWFFLNGAT